MNRHGKNRRSILQATLASTVGTLTNVTLSAPLHDVYRWGSSSLGSSGYVIMEAFSQTANRHTPHRNSALATAGTAENMYLIGQGALEFAHSTSVDWMQALAGRKPYPRPVHASQLFAYATWQQLPIVHADSSIRQFSGLAGMTFSPSLPGSGTAAMYRVLMNSAGMGDRVRWRFGSWSEIYTAFRAKQIDSVVGVLTNGIPSSGIQQLQATLEIRSLPVPTSVLELAHAANPGIIEGRLTPRDWAAIDEPVRVPALTGIVAASRDVSAEVGYTVTKAILDRTEDVKKLGAPLNGLAIETAARHLLSTAPVNAGAAQYFKENNVWRSDLLIAE